MTSEVLEIVSTCRPEEEHRLKGKEPGEAPSGWIDARKQKRMVRGRVPQPQHTQKQGQGAATMPRTSPDKSDRSKTGEPPAQRDHPEQPVVLREYLEELVGGERELH